MFITHSHSLSFAYSRSSDGTYPFFRPQTYRSEVLDGSVVTASFNRQSRTVSFQVDNDAPLVAFNCRDSVGELDELYPIVDMFDAPAQVSIVTRH